MSSSTSLSLQSLSSRFDSAVYSAFQAARSYLMNEPVKGSVCTGIFTSVAASYFTNAYVGVVTGVAVGLASYDYVQRSTPKMPVDASAVTAQNQEVRIQDLYGKVCEYGLKGSNKEIAVAEYNKLLAVSASEGAIPKLFALQEIIQNTFSSKYLSSHIDLLSLQIAKSAMNDSLRARHQELVQLVGAASIDAAQKSQLQERLAAMIAPAARSSSSAAAPSSNASGTPRRVSWSSTLVEMAPNANSDGANNVVGEASTNSASRVELDLPPLSDEHEPAHDQVRLVDGDAGQVRELPTPRYAVALPPPVSDDEFAVTDSNSMSRRYGSDASAARQIIELRQRLRRSEMIVDRLTGIVARSPSLDRSVPNRDESPHSSGASSPAARVAVAPAPRRAMHADSLLRRAEARNQAQPASAAGLAGVVEDESSASSIIVDNADGRNNDAAPDPVQRSAGALAQQAAGTQPLLAMFTPPTPSGAARVDAVVAAANDAAVSAGDNLTVSWGSAVSEVLSDDDRDVDGDADASADTANGQPTNDITLIADADPAEDAEAAPANAGAANEQANS